MTAGFTEHILAEGKIRDGECCFVIKLQEEIPVGLKEKLDALEKSEGGTVVSYLECS